VASVYFKNCFMRSDVDWTYKESTVRASIFIFFDKRLNTGMNTVCPGIGIMGRKLYLQDETEVFNPDILDE
jgi:hypothetical protein